MFAKQLKAARKAHGYTQQSLAVALGVSKGSVAMWETGKRQPPLEKLSEISDLLQVSTDYLIKGSTTAFYSIPCKSCDNNGRPVIDISYTNRLSCHPHTV